MTIPFTFFHRVPARRAICALALAGCISLAPSIGHAQQSAPDDANGASAQPVFTPVEVPVEEDRGVFVSQIGTTNSARIEQRNNRGYVRVVQDGANNEARLDQRDSGTHYSSIAQVGDGNNIVAAQEGNGETVLMLAQQGADNSAIVGQRDDGSTYSAAAVLQSGNGNSLVLVQDGFDNQARLTQTGDNNVMTATQLASGNRLEWTQDGSGLSDLQITQEGGQAMQILQTNGSGGGN